MIRKTKKLPFNEAKRIVQSEKIQSVAQYKRWHEFNSPAGIPKRPDRAYKLEFTTWNDFLGNDNPFPIKNIKYRPFIEAKAFAQSLNIRTKAEWLDICDTDKCPKDIPRRPDLYYRDSNGWVSWNNFLGANLLSKENTIAVMDSILFITQQPHMPKNYYRCGITNGGISSINDYLIKSQCRLVSAYYVPKNFNYKNLIESIGGYEDYETKDYYIISNITSLISKLSINFTRVKKE